MRVAACSIAPVKGLRIQRVRHIDIDPGGLRGDRVFHVIDDRSRMFNGKRSGALQEVTALLVEPAQLTLSFTGGARVSGAVRTGPPLEAEFFSRSRLVLPVEGPFSAALSDHVGVPLRLVVAADGTSAVDRGPWGAVTLVSQASLAALAALAGGELDARRFRMSIEVSGAEVFEEDRWVGRDLRVGGAVIRPEGHVGRCVVTSRDPDTGRVDVPTLDLLRSLRRGDATTEPLALGIHAAVVSPGAVAVGDTVQIADIDADSDRASGR